MKNVFLMMFAVSAFIGCSDSTNRCENGELSQAECCASDSKYCGSDADTDITVTDASDVGTDITTDAEVDATMGCDPPCTTGVCDTSTQTCVGCVGNLDCPTAKPVCNTTTNMCVGCSNSEDCSGDTGVCNPSSKTCVACVGTEGCGVDEVCDTNNTCVECLNNTNCDDGVCDTTSNTCVACLAGAGCSGELVCKEEGPTSDNACVACLDNDNCTTAAAAKCDPGTNECVKCSVKADCSHLALAKNHCDPVKGCLECTTATEAIDCTDGVDPTACNVVTNMCSLIKVKSGGTCQPCVSNSSCFDGYACVPTTFGANATPSGNYCMQVYDGMTACPNPYGPIESVRNDVNGNSVTVCMIRESIISCAAYNRYEDPCTPVACDTTLGGVCKQFGGSVRACTYECASNNDCTNGITCKSITGGKFCGATGP